MSQLFCGMSETECRRVVAFAVDRGWARRPGCQIIPFPAGTGTSRADDSEDRERATFLQRLVNSPIEIEDGELDFLSDLMSRPWAFDDLQREMIDALRTKYEGQL